MYCLYAYEAKMARKKHQCHMVDLNYKKMQEKKN